MLHVGIYRVHVDSDLSITAFIFSHTNFYEMLCELLRFLEEESQIDLWCCFRKGRQLLHVFFYIICVDA